MGRTVVKFGGSNLKSKGDIAKLIAVLNSYTEPPVVVVSAMYGITDILRDSLLRIKDDEKEISNLIRNLRQLNTAAAEEYITDPAARAETVRRIDERIGELKKYLKGVNFLHYIPEFTADVVLSYGERLSSLLLTAVLAHRKIACEEALPENIGLLTDGRFGNATIDLADSEKGVREALSERKIYIVPGFYGISLKGEITILGRGGSDYSAACIAACLGADSVDLWKDVPGFMTADPKLVGNARTIAVISYTEAAELAYFGARIIHPQTVEPLKPRGIPVRIFNIDDFDGTLLPCTVVGPAAVGTEEVIKSVTYSDDFGILKLIGPGVGIKPGIMARATERLAEAGINIRSIITAQTTINILLSRADLAKCREIPKLRDIPSVDEVEFADDIAIIAVVGESMAVRPGIAGRIFGAVSRAGINVRMISMGASPVAAYFIVDGRDRDCAVRAIHEEFFGTNGKSH